VLEMLRGLDALAGNLGLSLRQAAQEVAAKIKRNGQGKGKTTWPIWTAPASK